MRVQERVSETRRRKLQGRWEELWRRDLNSRRAVKKKTVKGTDRRWRSRIRTRSLVWAEQMRGRQDEADQMLEMGGVG